MRISKMLGATMVAGAPASPKGTSPGKDPCPQMSAGSSGRSQPGPGAGSSYQGPPAGVTAQ
jgi:hypothetical protein